MAEINELLDEVEIIIKKHGLLTGKEFLDLTENNMPLYNAYLSYWNGLVIPDIKDRIEQKINALDNHPTN